MSIQRVDPDPDCAICYSPSNIQCDCESKGLDQAVRDAEVRMMSGLQDYIRYNPCYSECIYILTIFNLGAGYAKEQKTSYFDTIITSDFDELTLINVP